MVKKGQENGCTQIRMRNEREEKREETNTSRHQHYSTTGPGSATQTASLRVLLFLLRIAGRSQSFFSDLEFSMPYELCPKNPFSGNIEQLRYSIRATEAATVLVRADRLGQSLAQRRRTYSPAWAVGRRQDQDRIST
ncbi:hypothetical protein PoB_007260100 [Plakobranchus ocellatus]|uniref:Uncharacterized protein n=1 Tax=Plakobranchus ocellatus TaxID=259542 RepID=A0AAV4DQG4_9GAST|nr:hypothetical protein PoB_007260100 [Plakobranchus ocellatus]